MSTLDDSLNYTANFFQKLNTSLFVSASGVSVPTTTYKTICSLQLPANGKYILLARCGNGSGSGLTNGSYRLQVTSGTAKTYNEVTSVGVCTGGGYRSLCGYLETGSTGVTISAQIYLYAGTATGGNAWIRAINIGGVTNKFLFQHIFREGRCAA